MRHITIGFSRPKESNLISNTIMKVQGADFSHVYMSFKSNSLERTLIYQANRSGVWFVGKERFAEHNEVVDLFVLSLTEEQYKMVLQSCVDLSGLKYGFLALTGIGIEKLLEALKIRSKNPLAQKNRYICSKLIGFLLEIVGIDVPEDLDEVTPKDLHSLLLGFKGPIKVVHGKADK